VCCGAVVHRIVWALISYEFWVLSSRSRCTAGRFRWRDVIDKWTWIRGRCGLGRVYHGEIDDRLSSGLTCDAGA
jgi:hypothetical protein